MGEVRPFPAYFCFISRTNGAGLVRGIDRFNGTLPFWARHLQQIFQCPDLMTKTSLIDGFEQPLCILAFPNIENDMGAKRTERALGWHFSPGCMTSPLHLPSL